MGHCHSERFWQHPQTDIGDITTKAHRQPMAIPGCRPPDWFYLHQRQCWDVENGANEPVENQNDTQKKHVLHPQRYESNHFY